MTEHKDIQNPENYSEAHYKYFEAKLFGTKSSRAELEEICMTLAHLPTPQARDLLEKFQNSSRSGEVVWLECAMEENKFLNICADNEQEERDMIALKLYYKKEEDIIELMGNCQTYEYRLLQYDIEQEALESIQSKDLSKTEAEDIKIRISVLHDLKIIEESQLEKAQKEIEMLEKINSEIKNNIATERYKNLKKWDICDYHFDGEEW